MTRRALEFARRAWACGELAVIKLGRYWCPWPNAEGFRSSPGAVASASGDGPLWRPIGLGSGDLRHDARAWFLLAGPLIYFCGLHMVFASSMRYRIPAEVPAMGLAAVGLYADDPSLPGGPSSLTRVAWKEDRRNAPAVLA